MVMDRAFVTTPPKLSVRRRVKLKTPPAVGVPVIAPVPAVRLRPGGSAPAESDQPLPPEPPDEAAVWLKEVPVCPVGNPVVVIRSMG